MNIERDTQLTDLISSSQLMLEEVRAYLVVGNEDLADETAQKYEAVLESILCFTPSSLNEFQQKLQFLLECLQEDSNDNCRFSRYKTGLLDDLSKLRENQSN